MSRRILAGLLAGLWLGLAAGAGASTIWEKTTIVSSFSQASAVHAADVNGDGRRDVVGAASSGPIQWWRNTGQGVFEAAGNTIASLSGATSVSVANLDGDSDADVLATGGNAVMWYENSGLVWTPRTIDSGLSGAREALAVDLDRNGDLDVLAAGDSNLIWYQNDGSQFFLPNTIAAFANGKAVDARDLDNDLDLDVVTCGNGTVTWYENNGAQTFTAHDLTTTFSDAYSIRIAELNGDNRPDLVTVSSDGMIWWWRNNGSGSFTAFEITKELQDTADVFPADLDGDGDLDLACVQENSNYSVIWFENRGAGSFQQHVLHSNWDALAVHAADVTGDSLPEILAASSTRNQIVCWNSLQTTTWEPVYMLRDATTYTSQVLNGNRLVLGKTFQAQIDICDVSDPAKPVVIGGYDQLGGDDYNPARFLAVSGDYLFVSNGEEQLLQVLNVSNPAAPVLASQWLLSGNARGIVLSGTTAFVGDNSGILYTFNIADPAALTLSASATIGNHLSGMALSGNYLYIADRNGYLTVADVSNPTAVAWVSSTTIAARASAMELEVAGGYVYVATLEEGVQIFDLVNPASPALVGRFTPFGTGMDVAVSGNRLLYTTASQWYSGTTVGLYLLDITAPAQPALLQAYTYVGETADSNNDGLHNVVFNGDYAYAAIWGQGLGVFRWNTPPATPVPTAPATVSKRIDGVLAYPNPAKGVVNFRLEEPAVEKLSIELYNLAGELVTKITADQPGQTFAWTIQDVAPGLYMYRTTITVNGEERKLKIKKLAILK